MNNPEGHLDQAERHVSETAERIAKQKELIAKMKRDGDWRSHARALGRAVPALACGTLILASDSRRV